MPIQISAHFGVMISLLVAARNRAWCLVSYISGDAVVLRQCESKRKIGLLIKQIDKG